MKIRLALLAVAALCLIPLASAAQQAALTPPERLVANIYIRQTAAP